MDVARIVVFVALTSFIGAAIYSIAAVGYLYHYYFAFAPDQRRGYKRIPRSIRLLGLVSILSYTICVVVGLVMAISTNPN
jgi:hypothetical protein